MVRIADAVPTMNYALQSRSSQPQENESSSERSGFRVQGSGFLAGRSVPLHRFLLLIAAVTLALLAAGGLVTSHGVGMAVPDWPNTYGYNLFLFPVSKWLGGILYEHTHRLIAAIVGLLTTILAAWLWVRETSSQKWSWSAELPNSNALGNVATAPIRKLFRGGILGFRWVVAAICTKRWLGIGAIVVVILLMGIRQMPVFIGLASVAPLIIVLSLRQAFREPGSLRWWGIVAFAAVILQGVLGGLRVVWLKDEIGIFHATLAQLFFVMICGLALVTSPWWQDFADKPSGSSSGSCWSPSFSLPFPHDGQPQAKAWTPTGVSRLLLATWLLLLAQLVVGATMRHQHAGLAIPDFPLAYGKLWPAMDADSVLRYNQQRFEILESNPITAFQIALQLTHRGLAMVIVAAVAFCAWLTRRQLGGRHVLSKLALCWLALIGLQASLGAATIWSNKAADIATAHVILGALSLSTGAMLWLISSQKSLPATARSSTLQVASSKLQVATTERENLQPATCNLL